MKYPMVEINWRDACTDHGWLTGEEVSKDSDDELALTVGFLVRENQAFIWVASTVDSDGANNARIKIPKAMIVTQREVSITGKRKPRGADKSKDEKPGAAD